MTKQNFDKLTHAVDESRLLKWRDTVKQYQIMRTATANQLSLMTHCRSTLEQLTTLIDLVAKEQAGYAEDPSAHQITLGKSISELIGDNIASKQSTTPYCPNEPISKVDTTRRLRKKLAQWMPAPYLINKLLPDRMHQLPEKDDSCDFCTVLAHMRMHSELYISARNSVANHHVLLVHSMANKFRYLGLPYDDLFQEGFMGLLKAVERYQPEKGFQFSTYAHRVIGQSIHLALDKQSHLVRKPYRLMRDKANIEKTMKSTEQKLGRSVRRSELDKLIPDELEGKNVYLDELVSVTADTETPKAIPEQDLPSLELKDEQFKTQYLCHQSQLDVAIKQLDPRSQEVIRMRFGIGIAKEHTLKEISENMSLSSERVRQIVLQAVQVLSSNLQRT